MLKYLVMIVWEDNTRRRIDGIRWEWRNVEGLANRAVAVVSVNWWTMKSDRITAEAGGFEDALWGYLCHRRWCGERAKLQISGGNREADGGKLWRSGQIDRVPSNDFYHRRIVSITTWLSWDRQLFKSPSKTILSIQLAEVTIGEHTLVTAKMTSIRRYIRPSTTLWTGEFRMPA